MSRSSSSVESEILRDGLDIAVIGMAGRFPGAPDLAAYWRNVRDGVESLSLLSEQDLTEAGVPESLRRNPHYVRMRGIMDGIDLFDAGFFGVTPREAEVMDPQHRLFLECAWETLESAGYDPDRFPGPIGVYAGSSSSGYLFNLFPRGVLLQSAADMAALLGVEKDSLCTRASYKLNLEGPSLAIQTACSTSLVAVHLACQGLLAGECDMALAGGVSITVPQHVGYLYQKGGIASPDGHCRAFDAGAQGTVGGSGVGLVLLKRLQEAQADRDHILAVIRGSAINNDGARKVGYTAPRIEGQANVIRAAQVAAGVDPRTIGYIEAHGTGTPMGDPIELAALTQAFQTQTDHRGFCAIGSVKTNIGHLDAAAGIAGLIKTVLALVHKQIPPSLHFTDPNPEIDFSATPFFVNTALRDWGRNGMPRRAGVSSFGLGGTNAHVVLEEAAPHQIESSSRIWHVLPISAKSPSALDLSTTRLMEFFAEGSSASFADIAYTLQVGRRHFPYRRVVLCHDHHDACRVLNERDPHRFLESGPVQADRPVAFLFPGQGAQHVDMAGELYREEPLFREEIDRCADLAASHLGCDLREILYPADHDKEMMSVRLNQTALTQPALFIVEYALAKLWMAWGVRPDAMIGHSIGEYVAACLAGVFSLEQAIRLVAERGRLMQTLPAGAMLAVNLDEADLASFLGSCSVAAVNGSRLSVLSGPTEAIETAAARLDTQGIAARRLHVSHAFHSAMVEPILPAFHKALEQVTFREPTIPFLSNVSGDWISKTEVTTPNYWVRHLRRTVRFSAGLDRLVKQANRVLLEVGPGDTLSTLARRRLSTMSGSDGTSMSVISSFSHPHKRQPGQAHVWEALGRVWLAGGCVDWPHIYAREERYRVPLPTYPFERQRYWVEAVRSEACLPPQRDEDVESEQEAVDARSISPGHRRPPLATPYRAPSNEMEQRLVGTWEELLKINGIGVHDSFFELGGESLLAVQLLSQVRTLYQREVAPADFFETPTIAGLAMLLADLRDHPAACDSFLVTAASPFDPAPLSFSQERLWFLDQLEAGSSFYHLAAALHLRGTFDLSAAELALNRIASRHDALRTTLATVDGRPVQRITPEKRISIAVLDLEVRSEEKRDVAIGRLAAEDARLPFTLDEGPLWRVSVVNVAPQEQVLLLTMHHIISDGWSLGVLVREFSVLYQEYTGGRPSTLPDLPIQYADYACWQRQRYVGSRLDDSLAYWKNRLGTDVPTLALPTDRPRPPSQSYRGALFSFVLPHTLVESLISFSRRQNVTLFTTMLAAFQVLLSRHSGQEAFAVGTPVANRTHREVEPLIGCFVNTLVLRTDLSGDPSFREAVGRARETVLGAQAHQDCPFEQVVDALQPVRDLSYSPLFQVMFSLDQDHLRAVDVPGIEATRLKVDLQHSRFDLTLDLTERDGELTGELEYSTDLFDAETITRMARHYRLVLEQVIAAPETRLSDVQLLTEPERRSAVVDWNATAAAYPHDQCVHQVVDQQAGRTPEAVAVRGAEQSLTYGELEVRAERVADALVAAGVGPNARVGLCVERSIAMVVGLLGILKAGGAYVPLDPRYPSERLALMTEDARVAGVVTQRALTDRLPACAAPVLYLNQDGTLPGAPPPGRRRGASHSAQTAYVIYTSGSTGRPKGVMISHRSVMNFLCAMQALLRPSPRDRVVAVTSLSFDIAVLEVFLPLMVGAECVLAETDTAADGTKLGHLVNQADATILQATPATWRMLLDAGWQGLPGLTQLCGGETLAPDLAARLSRTGAALWNVYGPTETTVWSAAHRVDHPAGPILIGRPLANTDIYLLDRRLQLVPIGVVGELYIGGDGLATGYWERPDLTAERFVPHPFREDGTRLYRTGDVGRRRTDGTIECLGRVDHQVKLRGYRIEPGEIETRLVEHPHIAQAVVVAREEQAGHKRLVGYLVATEPVASAEIREFLRRRLPEYMVPATYVFLDKLPLTPNGKVDRKALPVPEEGGSEARPYAAPRTELEATLAAIWREVLGVERVGIHDNFFELGGDSILSIQVVSRVRQQGIALTPRQLFQQQTIGELAPVVTRADIPPADDAADVEGIPLTPIQHWFFELHAPNPHHWNQSLLLELKWPLDLSIVTEVMEHVVAHHDALRLRFDRHERGWTQRYAAQDNQQVMHLIDLSSIPPESRRVHLDEEIDRWERSLDIAVGPQLRVVYFAMGGATPDRMLFVMHHLVTDGISWRIVMEDFHLAYGQLAAGLSVSLPTKSTSYARWATRLAEHVTSETLEREAAYWLDPAYRRALPIPVDHPTGDKRELVSETLHVWMDEASTHALLQDVPAVYRTHINDVLLTALVRTLGGWSGHEEVLLDLEGHGREDLFSDVDLSRTVGWFAGVTPILLSWSPDAPLADCLKSVKEQLRRLPHGGIGYGILRYLEPSTSTMETLRSYPASQVRFNYLGQMDHVLPADSPFVPSIDAAGVDRDPEAMLPYELDINSDILGERLHMSWTYSRSRYDNETVQQLSRTYLEILNELIQHCLQSKTGGRTPSDFPLSGLDQSGIDRFLETRRGIDDVYPLTALQQGFLVHTIHENSGVYIEQLSCTLTGDLNVPLFQEALQGIVDRHPILRTSFVWEGLREPLQIVHARATLPIEVEDWRGLSSKMQQARLGLYLRTARTNGIDLSTAPLLRVALIRIAEQAYFFVWNHHHVLLDGWCVSLLLKEVFLRYRGLRHGKRESLTPAPPYRNHIAWLRRQDFSSAERYWRAALAGFTASTVVAVQEHASPSHDESSLEFEQQSLRLPEDETQLVSAFCQRHKITFNTLIQGVWALLLRHYSGEDDVLFGVTVSGRPPDLPGVQMMIGLFLNTLPLRVRINSESSIVTWLQALLNQNLEMREFEYASLYQIQGWSDVPRGQPLFESLLVFENYPMGQGLSDAQDGVTVEDMVVEGHTHYPLTLDVIPGPATTINFIFDRTRIKAELVSLMLKHFRQVLEQIVAGPGRRLGEVTVLSAAEVREQTRTWNETGAAYPAEQSVAELFEAQVARTPAAVAVQGGAEALTYAELDARAAQVAGGLVAAGVGPDTVVAVLAARGVEWVTLLLGILKAGGGYLPLDPTHPPARWGQLLTQGHVRQVLTTEAERHRLEPLVAERPDLRVATRASLPAGRYPRLPRRTHPQQVGYVLFTSGSTGQPKGAVVSQQGMVNNVWGKLPVLGLTSRDVVAQTAGVGFDISVWQGLSALLCGGRVEILSDDVVQEPVRLLAEFARTGVTVAELVPSLLREVVAVEPAPALPALRWLLPTGEAVTPELCRAWLTRYPTVPLLNAYGPAECADDVAYYPLTRAPGAEETVVPIGRPAANLELYVLNADLAPVPVGVTGELWIGGVGVGRGYLGEPGRTAAAFGPHPFSEQPGQRLYRTGDLGRYRADGTLEFLGRRDQQVKVRGVRIELGEIEARLREHPAIGQAVVVARAEPAGSKRLVGYLVTTAPVAVAAVREFLGRRLPEYMVPAVYVVLDKLPLTPNGKVDRKALPAPEAGGGEARLYVAPRTEFETTLAAIWRQVLRVERVGIHDNFFELGGDSILSIQVIAQARERGIRVTPRQLFQHQTVAALAAVSTGKPAEAEREGPVQGAVPLTPIQQDFFAQGVANPHYYNQAVLLAVQPAVDLRRLEHAVQAVLAHHDAFRLRFTPTADGWRQAYAAEAAAVTVEYVDLAAVPVAEQAQALEAAATDRQARLDLTTGPVVRAVLFTRGPAQTARLLLVIHHLVVDGISWRILLEDLMTAYQALTTQAPVRLPTSSSFQAWATQLHAYSHSAALQAEAASWLAIEPAAAWAIPVEDPQGAATEADAEIVTVSVDAETTRQLVQAVPAAARTQLHEVLLAALVQVLSEWSGSAVVAFDLEGHGREDVFPELDVSRTVGWFTTVYPVVVRVAPGATPGAVLAAVKARVRRLPHKGLGYGLLRYGGGDPEVRRHLAAQPPAPVSFNYLGQLDQTFPPEAPVRPAPESVGPNQAAGSRLPYEWDINAHILDGRLHVLWGYSGRRYRRATMAALGERYEQALRTLIRECLAGEAAGYTPADFPDVELSPEALNHILEDIQ
ncbi:MAG: polyketide synthase module [Nitrospira sp.]|jgi:amino acid adenylation domain-containing protein/non-ribosomal peptide synthase protein (TIGR01720 family)|nr:MAG: polyketide synthase module [Nitrospira sp.]